MLVLVDLEDDDAICAVPEHVGSLESVAAEQLPRHDVGQRGCSVRSYLRI